MLSLLLLFSITSLHTAEQAITVKPDSSHKRRPRKPLYINTDINTGEAKDDAEAPTFSCCDKATILVATTIEGYAL